MAAIYALVLIEVVGKQTFNVQKHIKEFNEVGLVIAVAGTFDLAVFVKCDSPQAMGQFIVEQLEEITGVEKTTTFVGIGNIPYVNHIQFLNDNGIAALVLVDIDGDSSNAYVAAQSTIFQVRIAMQLAGSYDLAVLVHKENTKALGTYVMQEILGTDKIRDTVTFVVLSDALPTSWILELEQNVD